MGTFGRFFLMGWSGTLALNQNTQIWVGVSSSSSRAAHVPQRGPGQVKKKKEIGIFSNSHFQKPIPTLFGLAAQEIFMAFAYPASSHCTNVTSK